MNKFYGLITIIVICNEKKKKKKPKNKKKTNELTIKAMSKRPSILPKALTTFFQMQEKLETGENLNLKNFRKLSFPDGISVTFIL